MSINIDFILIMQFLTHYLEEFKWYYKNNSSFLVGQKLISILLKVSIYFYVIIKIKNFKVNWIVNLDFWRILFLLNLFIFLLIKLQAFFIFISKKMIYKSLYFTYRKCSLYKFHCSKVIFSLIIVKIDIRCWKDPLARLK